MRKGECADSITVATARAEENRTQSRRRTLGFPFPHDFYQLPQPLAKKICFAKIFCEEEERAFSAYCPALPNSRVIRSVPTTSVRGKKCERVINFCARRVAFRSAPQFAAHAAYAERCSGARYNCCHCAPQENRTQSRRRTLGFPETHDFFPRQFAEKSVTIYAPFTLPTSTLSRFLSESARMGCSLSWIR